MFKWIERYFPKQEKSEKDDVLIIDYDRMDIEHVKTLLSIQWKYISREYADEYNIPTKGQI